MTENTEDRVVRSLEDLAGLDLPDDGTGKIAPSWPMVRLVQQTSQMDGAGAHFGQFHHSDTDEYAMELRGTLLAMRDSRALFDKASDDPVCSSADGETPRPEQPLWQGMTEVNLANGTKLPVGWSEAPTVCAECPFSAWSGGDGSVPPPCKESMVFLLEREDGTPALLRVAGTSIRPVKHHIGEKLRARNLPLYARRWRFWSEERKAPGQRWAQLRVASEPATVGEVTRHIARLQEIGERFHRELEARVAEDLGPGPWDADAFWKAAREAGLDKDRVLEMTGGQPPSDMTPAERTKLLAEFRRLANERPSSRRLRERLDPEKAR